MKEKKILSIGIDDVIADFSSALKSFIFTEKYGRRPVNDSELNFCLTEFTEQDLQAFKERAIDSGLYLSLSPIKGARRTLNKLRKNGFSINIVSSRFFDEQSDPTVLTHTAVWLNNHNLPYDSLSFTKNKEIFEGDVFIESHPEIIQTLKKRNKNVLIYSNFENKNENGERVENWAEVYKFLLQTFSLEKSFSLSWS